MLSSKALQFNDIESFVIYNDFKDGFDITSKLLYNQKNIFKSTFDLTLLLKANKY